MMNKKIFVVGVFVLLMTILIIVDTYGLFETNTVGSKDFTIANWSISLNDENVSQSRTITLNDFTYTNGVHTQSNYFAPGSSAYFDLEIDATGTQVSVAYELTIDDSQIDDYPNIYFTIKDTDTNQVVNANTYNGLMLVSSANKTKTLRITLVWDDDPNYDESDTTLIGENLSFTINADFMQYLGE